VLHVPWHHRLLLLVGVRAVPCVNDTLDLSPRSLDRLRRASDCNSPIGDTRVNLARHLHASASSLLNLLDDEARSADHGSNAALRKVNVSCKNTNAHDNTATEAKRGEGSRAQARAQREARSSRDEGRVHDKQSGKGATNKQAEDKACGKSKAGATPSTLVPTPSDPALVASRTDRSGR
jgi:hypothetical protein